jgi:hypothetical protein
LKSKDIGSKNLIPDMFESLVFFAFFTGDALRHVIISFGKTKNPQSYYFNIIIW